MRTPNNTEPDHQGPTRGPNGKQLAPETFARWIVPGIWEDTDGAAHIDVPELLRVFKEEDTPENRREITEMAVQIFREKLGNAADVIIRR